LFAEDLIQNPTKTPDKLGRVYHDLLLSEQQTEPLGRGEHLDFLLNVKLKSTIIARFNSSMSYNIH